MEHAGEDLAGAVRGAVWDTLESAVPGAGGLVAIDHEGRVELCFNTPGMYRGWVDADGHIGVAIYGSEEEGA